MADTTLELLLKITADAADARRELERLRSQVSSGTAQMGGSFSGLSSTFNKLGASLESMGRRLTLTVTAPLVALATLGTKSALEIDKVRTKLTALEGDRQKAEARIRSLRALADESVGVTQKGALDTYAQLKGIGGILDETINKVISSTGKLNAAFDIEDLSGFIRNLNQIFAQGFERADIKEAIGRVPFFEQLLEQAFGTKDAAKLKALKESGKLTLDTYLQGLSEAINSDPRIGNIGESLSVKLTKSLERLNVALAPLGEVILGMVVPALEVLASYAQSASEYFSTLSEPVQFLIVTFGALAAALGPVLIVLGSIITTVGGAIGTIGTAAAAVGGLAPLIGIVVAALAGLVAQVAIVGAAWAAFATAAYTIWQENVGGIQTHAKNAFEAIRSFGLSALADIKQFWEQNWPLIQRTAQQALDAISAFWEAHGADIVKIVRYAWGVVSTVIQTGLRLILGAIQLTLQVINGEWSDAWETFQVIVARAADATVKILVGLTDITQRILKGVAAAFVSLYTAYYNAAVGLARRFVDGWVAYTTGEGRERMAMAAISTALMLSSPAILAYYAAAGALAAKARNDALLNGLSVGTELGGGWDNRPAWQSAPVATPGLGGGGGGKGGGGGDKNKALEEYLTALREAKDEQGAIYSDETQKLERELNRRIISLNDYTERAKQLRKDEFNELIDRINDELIAIQRSSLSDAEKLKRKAAIDRETRAATEALNRDLQELEDRKNERIEQAGLAHRERMADLADRGREREIAEIEKGMDAQAITVEDGTARIEKILEDSLEQRRAVLQTELELAGQNAQAQQEVYDKLAATNDSYTARFIENAERRNRTLTEERQRLIGPPQAPAGVGPNTPPWQGAQDAAVGAAQESIIGPPPDISGHLSVFEILKNAGMQAFGSLTQGAGRMIEAFLAGGKAGEMSFKQLAKSVAASLAAQALVHAAMEVAHGIAELAKAAANPIGAGVHAAAAALHFASAKAFGIVGGIAAVAALAIPGGSAASSASRESAAAGAYGAGGGQSGPPYSNTPGGIYGREDRREVETGRNQMQQPIILRLELNDRGVLNVLQEDVQRNGTTRNLIIDVVNAVS